MKTFSKHALCTLLLTFAIVIEFSRAIILTDNQQKKLRTMDAFDRQLFLETSRNVEMQRYMEREKFREMLNRMMNSMVRRHNTENEMYKIETEAYIDLQRRFGRTEGKIDRMRDHTVGMVNDLIALS